MRPEQYMKQSLTKLVDSILKKLDKHPENAPSESGIRSWLVAQGYTKRDIDAAMRLIRPRLADCGAVATGTFGPVRSFSAFENFKLTPEARNALVRLDLYQLITPYEREMVLDRLNYFDTEVGLEEIDFLLSWVLSQRDVEFQHTVSDVVEGRGDILH